MFAPCRERPLLAGGRAVDLDLMRCVSLVRRACRVRARDDGRVSELSYGSLARATRHGARAAALSALLLLHTRTACTLDIELRSSGLCENVCAASGSLRLKGTSPLDGAGSVSCLLAHLAAGRAAERLGVASHRGVSVGLREPRSRVRSACGFCRTGNRIDRLAGRVCRRPDPIGAFRRGLWVCVFRCATSGPAPG